MDRRKRLALVFQDTRNLYETNARLRAAADSSRHRARLYRPGDDLELPAPINGAPVVTVSGRRTFEAARDLLLADPADRVAVLNFASATNPGGGVLHGSSAQEESLCRCSTLYPTLDQRRFWDGYYHRHRKRGDATYSDACIYSPGVVVFKRDAEYPELVPEGEWFEVDVITCAAPNLRRVPRNAQAGRRQAVGADELYRIHVRRGRRICEVAASNGVTSLVLGAFGCGAFCNDPRVVASAYKAVLGEVGPYFKRVEFAVFCAPGRESENLRAFEDAFALA